MNMRDMLRAEKIIAKRYEEMGYSVTFEPSKDQLPFSLNNYTPDILATKGDEHILIEVKSSNSRLNPLIIKQVDDVIQNYAGWRFLIATVTEEDLIESANKTASNASIEQIESMLQKIDLLSQLEDTSRFIMPQLWVVYISALRNLCKIEKVPTESLTDSSLLNRAYSDGIISTEELSSAKRFMKLRNNIVHSLDLDINPEDCQEFRSLIDQTIKRIYHKIQTANN